MCWIQRRLAKQTSNMLCPVEAVGLACMGAPKRARSVHLRAFTLSAPSVCRHFPRCPHSSLPLCSRTNAVGKFNVTSPPLPPPRLPHHHIHLPCSLHQVLPSCNCLVVHLCTCFLSPLSELKAQDSVPAYPLPTLAHVCGVEEGVSLVAEMRQSLLWGIPMPQSGNPFPSSNLCLSGCSFLPERMGVAPGGKAEGVTSSDRKWVLGGQAWADLKTEGEQCLRGSQCPWVQEHIREKDTVLLPFLVPWLPCHLEEGTEEMGGAVFP